MSKLNIKPLRDRIVIERDQAEDQTAGGIIIPEAAKEKPVKGTVVAAGPGTKDEPTMVKVGDKVLYNKHSGSEVEVDGKRYLIMREQEIFAVVN